MTERNATETEANDTTTQHEATANTPQTVSPDRLEILFTYETEAATDQEIVAEHVANVNEGYGLPTVDVYEEDGVLYVGPGRLVVEAARLSNVDVPVRLLPGGRSEALLQAIVAECATKSVVTKEGQKAAALALLNDPTWGNRSARWIGRQTGLSDKWVTKIAEDAGLTEKRKGIRETPRGPMNTSKIGAKANVTPVEDSTPITTPNRKQPFTKDETYYKVFDATLHVHGHEIPVQVTETAGWNSAGERVMHVSFVMAGPSLETMTLSMPDGSRSALTGSMKFTKPGVIAVEAFHTKIEEVTL